MLTTEELGASFGATFCNNAATPSGEDLIMFATFLRMLFVYCAFPTSLINFVWSHRPNVIEWATLKCYVFFVVLIVRLLRGLSHFACD